MFWRSFTSICYIRISRQLKFVKTIDRIDLFIETYYSFICIWKVLFKDWMRSNLTKIDSFCRIYIEYFVEKILNLWSAVLHKLFIRLFDISLI